MSKSSYSVFNVPLMFLYFNNEALLVEVMHEFITMYLSLQVCAVKQLCNFISKNILVLVHSAQILFDPQIIADFMN